MFAWFATTIRCRACSLVGGSTTSRSWNLPFGTYSREAALHCDTVCCANAYFDKQLGLELAREYRPQLLLGRRTAKPVSAQTQFNMWRHVAAPNNAAQTRGNTWTRSRSLK